MEKSFKFTKAKVEALAIPPGETDFAYYDTETRGFGVRFQGEGGGTYFIKYKIGDKYRRVQLGRVGEVSLVGAQAEAQAIRTKVKVNKVDPATERARSVAKIGETFHPAIDGYLAKLAVERSASYHVSATTHLNMHFKPFHGMALTAITRKMVSDQLKNIGKNCGPIAANRARSTLSAFFNWAIREGFEGLESNPAHMTNKNAEEPRNRDLSARELKKIWTLAPQDEFGDIIRLLMLTMQRRTEIAGMPMKEFNRKERQIEIAAERTKNGNASIIPLSDVAFDILNKYHDSGRQYLFGRNDSGFGGWTKSKDRLDGVLKLNEHWTFHDFRRAGKTAMEQELDPPVADNISEAILNHSKKGLAKVYNGATYIKQKRDALDRYAAHLMKIVNS